MDIHARVNHGRWIVDCPYCNGAELAGPSELFFCNNCKMATNGGQALAVSFPPDKEAIEALLSQRTKPNRNWSPGETLIFLQAENAEHGVN